MIDKKSMNKVIAVATIFVVVFAVFFAYKQYDDYKILNIKYKNTEQAMKEEQNKFISAILHENQEKASLMMNIYAKKIQNNILDIYQENSKQLEIDITRPTEDSKLARILDKDLGEVYLNKDTNSNKPFVASVNNILWNNSMVVNSMPRRSLDWQTFIKSQPNQELTKEAIDCIKNMNYSHKSIIFWKVEDNGISGKSDVSSMTTSELLEMYNKYGLESMKNYEMLVPAYITKSGDIFNTKDLTNLGYKVSNYKIIIVQRMNIYDILSKYDQDLMYFNTQINRIKEEINLNDQYKLSGMIGSICVLIVILLISGYVQNKLNKKVKSE